LPHQSRNLRARRAEADHSLAKRAAIRGHRVVELAIRIFTHHEKIGS